MTTKHTPGPWITDSKERTDTARYIMAAARPFPHTIARIDLTNRAEDEANAALIAAAPELLEALNREQEWRDREAVGALDEEWDYETMVGQYRRAAIAKAEGRQ